MRSATVAFRRQRDVELGGHHLAGQRGIGLRRQHHRGGRRPHPDVAAGADPEVVEVVGVDPEADRGTERGQDGDGGDHAPVVEATGGDQPHRVAACRPPGTWISSRPDGQGVAGRRGGAPDRRPAPAAPSPRRWRRRMAAAAEAPADRRCGPRPTRPGVGPPAARPTRPRGRRSGRGGAPGRRVRATGVTASGATTPSAAPGESRIARVMPRWEGASCSISSQTSADRVEPEVGVQVDGELGGDHPVRPRLSGRDQLLPHPADPPLDVGGGPAAARGPRRAGSTTSA